MSSRSRKTVDPRIQCFLINLGTATSDCCGKHLLITYQAYDDLEHRPHEAARPTRERGVPELHRRGGGQTFVRLFFCNTLFLNG